MEECFICEKTLADGNFSQVKEKGIKKLISSSIKRGENSHQQKLESLDSVVIHTVCWKKYNI